MRQPGIVGLHTLTTTNALHYAYEAAGDDETRRLLLLQNAAFLPLFREAMEGRGKIGEQKIAALEPAEIPSDTVAALDGIFADISGDRLRGGPAPRSRMPRPIPTRTTSSTGPGR